MPAPLPVVAVVGRPNVGKSSLVNRILGRRAAVVQERPGVTRDRREFEAEWTGRPFLLVDTGGWEARPGEELVQAISEQAEAAMTAADVVLFVVDATAGISEEDAEVVKLLRRAPGTVLLVANKIDDAPHEETVHDLWKLGLGRPYPVSAIHGRGIGDLLDVVVEAFPKQEAPVEHAVPTLAIIGRPNVGKSTLLNRLAGEERVLVSPTPGTTRDPIDTLIDLEGRAFRVVDTAGIRRAAKVKEAADYYSVLRAREALADADVALLLLDPFDGVVQQDQRLAEEAAAAGAGLVILLNKWDAADLELREQITEDLGRRLGFVGWAPVLRISALTGARLHRLGPALDAVLENRRRRISTGRLNKLIRSWQSEHPPPVRKGRRPRVLYAVQVGVEPPTIVLFVGGGELGPDYLRFLERRFRETEDFVGTPIRLVQRPRESR